MGVTSILGRIAVGASIEFPREDTGAPPPPLPNSKLKMDGLERLDVCLLLSEQSERWVEDQTNLGPNNPHEAGLSFNAQP